MKISGALFFIAVFILLPILSFSLIACNDKSCNLNKIQPYYFKYIRIEHVIMPIVVIIFHAVLMLFESNSTPEEAKEASKIPVWILYFLFPVGISILSSHLFVGVYTKHVFRYLPAMEYDFHFNFMDTTYQAYIKQVDDGYEKNKLNLHLVSTSVFFIIISTSFIFLDSTLILLAIFAATLFLLKCIAYTMVKDLIGAGGIQEKETSKVNAENINLELIPIKEKD